MITTHTRTLKDAQGDSHEYMVTQFPARKGLRIQTNLAKTLAPVISGLKMSVGGGSLLDADLSLDGSQMVNTILEHIDDAKVLALVLGLLEMTRRDGAEITEQVFDTAYCANYGELVAALNFVIEANSFFGIGPKGGGVSALFQSLAYRANSTTTSPPSTPSGV